MSSVKSLLLGSSVLAATAAVAFSAQAQSAPADQTGATQEVVVTGSRLAQPNLEQPTPVQQASQLLIQNSGTPNLGDILAQLPALGATGTVRANSNNFGNGFGISSADLRNLGLSRTLVLVDGYRHVAGDISTDAVDLNSIPTALVDHVEVITGGASALYGSDAVSGVVNIILKKKFEGVSAQAEVGGDDGGYNQQYSTEFTVGHNFLNDRLHVDFTGFWTKQEGVDARNLPNAHNYGTVVNPADATCAPDFSSCGNPTPNNGIPDRLYVQNVGTKFVTANGVLLNPNTDQPEFSFNSAGRLVPVPTQTGYNSFAFGQLPRPCADCYYTEDYEQLQTPVTTEGTEFRASYDFNPHIRAFVDAKYVQTRAVNTIQPSFDGGALSSVCNTCQLQPDNAFIQPDLRAALAGTAPADYPLISGFFNPGRQDEALRRTYRVVAGFEGDFDVGPFANVKWDAAVNYGRTNSHFDNENLEVLGNFAAALDSVVNPATGQAACRINVPSAQPAGYAAPTGITNAAGCVPFNPFGRNQLAGANAYSFGQFDTVDSLSQQDATINLRSDTSKFFNLPGGPIGIAVGGEYRMERTFEINDPSLLAGLTEDLATNSSGGFNVYEGYVEGNAPIFKHNGFLRDELSFDAAYRGAQYSYKQVGYADAYKFGTVYGPFDWIKLRGTYSRAIRAPDITEAFSPPSAGFFSVTDPCSQENITSNVNYAKNCAANGIPTGFQANTNASITGTTSGNPNLNPEKSFSYTGGFVLQPTFIPRLSITVDYYAIKIKNAITQVQAQDIINNCYNETSGLNSQYCSLFTRDPGTHNINFVSTTYVNAAKLETQGVDIQASYSTPVEQFTRLWKYSRWATGTLNVDLNANYLIDLHDFPFQNDPTQVQIFEGTVDNPHLRALADIAYRQGPWQVVWTTRYVGRGATFDRDPTQSDFSESTNVPFVGARFYHDIAVHYTFDHGPARGVEVYGGIKDLFGELPPFVTISSAAPDGVAGGVQYDLGRYIFAGAKVRL